MKDLDKTQTFDAAGMLLLRCQIDDGTNYGVAEKRVRVVVLDDS